MELTIEQALQQGVAAFKEGKLQDAESLYRAILQFKQEHPDANHNLGVISLCFNKVNAALPFFKTALEANPKIEQFWLSYIDALIKAKQFDNAKQVFEQAKMQGVDEVKLDSLEAQLSTRNTKLNTAINSPPQEQLKSLLEHYQKGQFGYAEKLARSISQEFPQHQYPWKVLGAILGATGRNAEALSVCQTAVELSPQDGEAHNNLGIILKELGRLQEAEASYTKALGLKPYFAQAHNNLGIILKELGRLDEAEASYTKALEFKPGFAQAHYNLGVILQKFVRLDEAEASYTRALELKPDFAEAHNNLGITLKELGRLDEAEASYIKALRLKPNYAEAHSNLGVTLLELGKLDEAKASFTQAIVLQPDFVEAHNNLGIILKEQGRLEEAVSSFTQAITLKPDFGMAYSNLGIALKYQGKLDNSTKAHKKSISLAPFCAEYYNNLGSTLKEYGKLDQAQENFYKAISLKPNYADAYFNLSLIKLLHADFKSGLELYEWRQKRQYSDTRSPRKNLEWDGIESLSGKKILVYEEQGLGDIIQFCRYLPLLNQKGAKVIFLVKKKMHALLCTLDENIILTDSILDNYQIDFETPLMSLPFLFNTNLTTIPAKTPYLFKDKNNMLSWAKSFKKNTFKIGICWQGSKSKIDYGRSFDLSLFDRISKLPNVELISLHKGEGEKQTKAINFNLTIPSNFDSGENAFVDTAAIMMNCDLIITSDTAIAHLAGSLGCRTWVVLKKFPDWRWMLERKDSPWYPNLSLYRQKEIASWKAVFDNIQIDLELLIKEQSNKK